MRKLFLAGSFLVLAGLALHGQATVQKPFVVQYVDGRVEMRVGAAEKQTPLAVKAMVSLDATIIVAKGAMIELKRDATVISLIKAGTYKMAELAGTAQGGTGAGLVAIVASKLKAVTSQPTLTSTVAGVRADPCKDIKEFIKGGATDPNLRYCTEVKGAAKIMFVYWGLKGGYIEVSPDMAADYEEYKNAVDEAIRALLRKQYGAAIEYCMKAFKEASPGDLRDPTERENAEMRTAAYLLACAHMENGSMAQAWKAIKDLGANPGDREYKDILIRKAQLQVDGFLFDEALATLRPLLQPLDRTEFGQAASLVAYHALAGLGRTKEAGEVKKNGLAIDQATSTGKVLAGLK
jgi:predicted negative regulator of RcsB-dependent stress response